MPSKISGKAVSVVGLGISGFEAAFFLRNRGAKVFVSELSTGDSARAYQADLAASGIEAETGGHSLDRILGSDLIVISPGISPKAAVYRAILERCPEKLISEIELASAFCPCEMIAVTGTNGKTTTTSLIAGLFNHFGIHAIACGNIGNPFIAEIERFTPNSKAVIEVSSFQLENTRAFRPRVALLLNITPDHFDWHGGMEGYVRAKAKIFRNQGPEDFAVLNRQDEPTRSIVSSIPSKVLYFNVGQVENPNWDAVLQVADIYGFPRERALQFLRDFPGIDHRMEKVPSGDGIVYINDSKSTNPSSLEWALQRMKEPAILLCGGRNKGNDFRPMAALLREKVKYCFVFGEAANEMEDAWKDAVPVAQCGEMLRALEEARKVARRGDTVLLSPACASFDQFKNYKDRGEKFKKMVGGQSFEPVTVGS